MNRVLTIAICALIVIATVQCASSNAEPQPITLSPKQSAALPLYTPRFDREEPVIAVVAENTFTELTDYVVPYGVLSRSNATKVIALSTAEGSIQMFPALRVEPQSTVAEFDKEYPRGADYVIVPAVHRTEDAALLAWVSAQASKGATIVGVCDGVWVLANAGLLENRKAVGHWYSFERLENEFRQTEWFRDTRYVADKNRITTTGVTASIPVSIAIVEAIAGREIAQELADAMGIKTWGTEHQSDQFELNAQHIWTAAGNWISRWSHEEIGIPIANGVDEVALALVADSFSRTYRSSAFSVARSTEPITTRHGLVILPDRTQGEADSLDRIVDLHNGTRPISALDESLEKIEDLYGAATAEFVALQLEYPRE